MRSLFFAAFIASSLSVFAQDHLTSGGKLKPEQAIMDIRHYTVSLDVDPANQSIAGFTTIDLNLSQSTNVLLFDLLDSFQIKSVVVNGKVQTYKYKII